jgi:hypothetical protein
MMRAPFVTPELLLIEEAMKQRPGEPIFEAVMTRDEPCVEHAWRAKLSLFWSVLARRIHP